MQEKYMQLLLLTERFNNQKERILENGTTRDIALKWGNMYREALIYQNIYEALQGGVIAKSGNPPGWDQSSFTERNP